jgi:hypothetical protein
MLLDLWQADTSKGGGGRERESENEGGERGVVMDLTEVMVIGDGIARAMRQES